MRLNLGGHNRLPVRQKYRADAGFRRRFHLFSVRVKADKISALHMHLFGTFDERQQHAHAVFSVHIGQCLRGNEDFSLLVCDFLFIRLRKRQRSPIDGSATSFVSAETVSAASTIRFCCNSSSRLV